MAFTRSCIACSSRAEAERAVARHLEAWLQQVWYGGRGGGAWLLPLSWLYGAVSALHRIAHRSGLARVRRAAVPVVVVGNITAGGTGKSPLVAALAAALTARGIPVGVLLRGYGARRKDPARVVAGDDPLEVGDEAVMLADATGVPVVAGVDRARGAALLVAAGARLVLCDDGLQHPALARDLEIAVVDAVRGIGNGRLLPAGPLREVPSRLTRVDWVIWHGEPPSPPRWRGTAGSLAMQLEPGAVRPIVGGAAPRSLASFAGKPVHAVAGIGDPGRFFAMLRAAGLAPHEHPFPDHHAYTPQDLDFGDDAPVLMTAKDAVKCRRFADPRLWEVPVVARLSPADGAALIDQIAALVAAQRNA
jgi:tetraacyldisaccharide 4'-kinase